MQTILVVEDYYFTRLSLVTYLQHQGYRVIEAAHAAEALTQAQHHQPDLAVVDIVIPADDSQERGNIKESVGLELVAQLKQLQANMGIVILSAHDDRRTEVLALFHHYRGLVYQIKGSRRPEYLDEALRLAARGDVWIDPEASLPQTQQLSEFLLSLSTPAEQVIIKHALAELHQLTPTEQLVMEKISQARSNSQTAEELNVKESSVKGYINALYAKLFQDQAKQANLRPAVLLAKVALIDRARRLE